MWGNPCRGHTRRETKAASATMVANPLPYDGLSPGITNWLSPEPLPLVISRALRYGAPRPHKRRLVAGSKAASAETYMPPWPRCTGRCGRDVKAAKAEM